MPLVPGKQVLDEAVKGGYGVGAYNVNNMEQIQAIMAAAAETQSPVIIQASRGALKYSNFTYLKHLMDAAVEENPGIPVCLTSTTATRSRRARRPSRSASPRL